jgi:hypothetical protein
MELKTARLTLLIDPQKKAAFEALRARQDLTPSQVVRQLIRDLPGAARRVLPAQRHGRAKPAQVGQGHPAARVEEGHARLTRATGRHRRSA